MKIFTSYFANIRNLPDDVEPVAICLIRPKFYNGLSYEKLAPSKALLFKWKEDQDEKYYVETYERETLSKLDVSKTYDDLIKLVNGKTPCLVCYEKSSDFCHRHLVAKWLNTLSDVQVEEFERNKNVKNNNR